MANWSGYLTNDNAARVARMLTDLLEGKVYTTEADGTIQREQHLTPRDSSSGMGISVGTVNGHKVIYIVDTYGSSPIHVREGRERPHFTFRGNQVTIVLYSQSGRKLTWKYTVT